LGVGSTNIFELLKAPPFICGETIPPNIFLTRHATRPPTVPTSFYHPMTDLFFLLQPALMGCLLPSLYIFFFSFLFFFFFFFKKKVEYEFKSWDIRDLRGNRKKKKKKKKSILIQSVKLTCNVGRI